MFKRGKYSVRTMLLLPMLLANLLIVAVFALTINVSDIDMRIRQSDLSLIQRTMTARADTLQDDFDYMEYVAANIAERVHSAVSGSVSYRGSLDDAMRISHELTEQALEAAVPTLLDSFKVNDRITGAFFVLDASVQIEEGGGLMSQQAAAVYIADHNLRSLSSDTSGLSLLYGPEWVAADNGFSLGDAWREELSISAFTQHDFLLMPFAAAAQNPALETRQLGYWSRRVTREDGSQVLTYTLPLRDSGQLPYGVVGVELSLSELTDKLSPAGLGYPDQAFYAITSVQGDLLDTDWIVSNGVFAHRYLDDRSVRQRPLEKYGPFMLQMSFEGGADATVAFEPFHLYAPDNIHYGETWALVAGVDNKALYAAANSMRNFMWMSVIVSMVLGGFFSLLCSNLFVAPITRLSVRLQSIDPEDEVRLTHTNIKEIDLLIDSIEQISHSLIETNNRTIQAIEMTEMPIGFFAINEAKERVYMTDYLIDLFQLTKRGGSNYIPFSEYSLIFDRLLQNKDTSEDNVYLLDFIKGQSSRLLRIKQATLSERAFGIVIDVTADVLEKRRLELERDTDPLTGLLNRNAFFSESRRRLASLPDKYGVMLFADLDDLKHVNDTYGHDFGDRYIRKAAGVFQSFVHHGGVVSRISGDEFGFFLYGYDDRDILAKIVADTFMNMDKAYIDLPDGGIFKIRCSIGFAWYPDDSSDLEQLLKYADFAMYETKRSVKGSIREFNLESYLQNSYMVEKNEDFNRFIERNQVRYAFQPIVDIYSGAVFAYEALMRPTLPAFQTPGEALRIAHAQAKLYQIERMTVFNLCAWFAGHEDQLTRKKLFINCISSQRLSNKDRSELAMQYGRLLGSIVFEFSDYENTDENGVFLLENIESVRRFGAGIAIDNFGLGKPVDAAALTSRPDYVKVDRTLVSGIHLDEEKQKQVARLIERVHDQGVKVIAEGVEEAAEAETIIRLGADYLQGYFISHPSFQLEEVPDAVCETIRGFSAEYRDRRRDRDR